MPATPPSATPVSAAADALSGAPRPARTTQEFEELQILHRFLSLPPERLAEIRQTIEKIEKLTPEERAALRTKVEQLRKDMPADEFTNRLGPEWQKFEGKDKFMIVSAMRFMSEEDRRVFFARFNAAEPEQKKAMLKDLLARAKERFRDGGEGFKRRDKDSGPDGPDGKPQVKPGEGGPRPPRPDRPPRPHGGEAPPSPPAPKEG